MDKRYWQKFILTVALVQFALLIFAFSMLMEFQLYRYKASVTYIEKATNLLDAVTDKKNAEGTMLLMKHRYNTEGIGAEEFKPNK